MLADAYDARPAAYICAEILVHMHLLHFTSYQCTCRHGNLPASGVCIECAMHSAHCLPLSCHVEQVMYQLQRGPMLGDVAGHADERALLHACFLAASSPVALLMMAPALYLFSPGTAAVFQQVPALDLALQPGQPIFHETLILIEIVCKVGSNLSSSTPYDMQTCKCK